MTPGIIIYPNVFYGIRVEVVPEGGATRVRAYLDGDLLIDATDSDHTAGRISLFHDSGISAEFDEIEMFLNPLDVDTVDINS